MSYVRVDSSVPRNRKFLQAGPAPSWLWLCGLAYCQEGLTDGFIPDEAIDLLGVPKNARRLAPHLEAAGLWEKVDGGWQVHDYLKHNRSAAQVNAIKDERREHGRSGGKASGEARSKQTSKQSASKSEASSFAETKQTSKHTSNPYVDVDATAVVAASVVEEGGLGETNHDAGWWAFKAAYPIARRVGGHAERLYFDAIHGGDVRHEDLMAALDNHKASEQWQNAKFIPNMQKWLEDKSWEQRLPPPKAVGTNTKTAGNADAVRQFLAKHLGEKHHETH